MDNPFQKLRQKNTNQAQTQPVEPAIFVIFGITGNLAQKRLLPALYHLLKDDLLNEHTQIVGVSRQTLTKETLLSKIELCVLEADKTCDPVVMKKFRDKLKLVKFNPVRGGDYDGLLKILNAIEAKHGVCMNRLFYLSIPPQVYEPVIENFGKHHLNEGCQHGRAVSRLLVEKPFGYDLASAKQLIKNTARYFSEAQVFRIDHYLAKETVQNILVFRKRNPIFVDIWDRRHISAIDLIFSEKIGVQGRKEFYDGVGAMRDVVQNHMMQLLALVTMDIPPRLDGRVHRAKRAVLRAVAPVDMRKGGVVRGQYVGYQREVDNPGSTTETYVRLPLTIRNGRWRGVVVTMAAGKALKNKDTSITITFMKNKQSSAINRLTFRIQPNEGIDIEVTAKRPGFEDRTSMVRMDFSYGTSFRSPDHPDAYERVLVDAVRGDHSLFATSDEVLEAWRILQPVLTSWSMSKDKPILYKPGSAGPEQA